jgi:single-strand DNA-binding protein
MYNKIIIVGNLTRDPELKHLPSGTAVAKFGLASTDKYVSGGEKKEKTLFIDVAVWGKQGETVAKYLEKGRQVLVEGSLEENKWEYEGVTKSKMQINASEVKFLGSKGR